MEQQNKAVYLDAIDVIWKEEVFQVYQLFYTVVVIIQCTKSEIFHLSLIGSEASHCYRLERVYDLL